MAAQKGHPKWGGRKKGVINKDKQAIVEKIANLWDGYSEAQMMSDLLELSANERLKIMIGMAAEFCAPKLARQEVDLTTEGEKIQVNIVPVGKPDKD